MTQQQALKEARKRWGKNAYVLNRGKSTVYKDHVISGPFRVGKVEMNWFFSVKGDGSSWEQLILGTRFCNVHLALKNL